MYRKRKRHKNRKGKEREKYTVLYSTDPLYETKAKKKKKKTILGLEPNLFEQLCESVPLSRDINVLNVKYRY